MHVCKFAPLLSVLILVGAWDFPFFDRAVYAAQQTFGIPNLNRSSPLRIAVIGAGAGGSSAAYWIARAKERHGFEVEVDIFDKNSYIGGRSTVVYPHNDKTYQPMELGGSIFVKANKNLFRAVEEFNLTLKSSADKTSEFGLWNGEKLVVTYKGGWLDTIRLAWRYGLSAPTKTKAIVKDMIDRLLLAYTPKVTTWSSIEALSETIGFTRYTSWDTLNFFTSQGVNERWVKEMIEGATRVNYAQDVTELHGLGGAVCMAATGASSVLGGNFQIYEGFVKRSGAKLHLNTPVEHITKSISSSGKIEWKLRTQDSKERTYDHIVLATPFHLSGVSLHDTPASQDLLEPAVDYVQLHVTLLSTTAKALPERFGLSPGSVVPSVILTTTEGTRIGSTQPEMQSLADHLTYDVDDHEEHLFKIFSLDEKSDEWLEGVFGAGSVRWVHRKLWHAYPKLRPTATFPPIRADDGFWYVNSMESFISTMETEVLAARNVVDNLVREAFGNEKGICPTKDEGTPSNEATEEEVHEVYGWDC